MGETSYQGAFFISEEDEVVIGLHVVSHSKGTNLGKGILDIVSCAGEVPEPILLVLQVEADALPVLHRPQEGFSRSPGQLDLLAGACIREREALDIANSALASGTSFWRRWFSRRRLRLNNHLKYVRDEEVSQR